MRNGRLLNVCFKIGAKTSLIMTSNPIRPSINNNSSILNNSINRKHRTNYSIRKLSTQMMVVSPLPKAKMLWTVTLMQLTKWGNGFETNFPTRQKTAEKQTRICWRSLLTTTSWSLYHIGKRRPRQMTGLKRWTIKLIMKTCRASQTQVSSMVKLLTRTSMTTERITIQPSPLFPNPHWSSSKVFQSLESHPQLWLMPPFWNQLSQLRFAKLRSRIPKEKSQLNLSEMRKKSSQKSAPSNQKLILIVSRVKWRSPGRSVGIA